MSTATPRHTTRHPERPNVYRLVHPRWSIAGHAAAEGRPRRLTRMPTKPGPVDDSERKRRRTSSHSTLTTIVASRPSCARGTTEHAPCRHGRTGAGGRRDNGGQAVVSPAGERDRSQVSSLIPRPTPWVSMRSCCATTVDRRRTVPDSTLVPTAAGAARNTLNRVPKPRASGSTPLGATRLFSGPVGSTRPRASPVPWLQELEQLRLG